jgi:hypothetical protein
MKAVPFHHPAVLGSQLRHPCEGLPLRDAAALTDALADAATDTLGVAVEAEEAEVVGVTGCVGKGVGYIDMLPVGVVTAVALAVEERYADALTLGSDVGNAVRVADSEPAAGADGGAGMNEEKNNSGGGLCDEVWRGA